MNTDLHHENIPVNTVMYTYDKVIERFKKLMLETDLLKCVGKFNHIHNVTSVTYRKRMIKSRLDLEAIAKPTLVVNASIFTDDLSDDMFGTEFFNTDTTGLLGYDYKGYSDPIVDFQDYDKGIDASLYAIPKRGAINIEFTIVEDSLLKIETIKEAWNKLKYNNNYYSTQFVTETIIPLSTVLNLLYNLGHVTEVEEFADMEMNDILNLFSQYVNPAVLVEVGHDGGRGTKEIVMKTPVELLIKPELINVGNFRQAKNTRRDYTLTRTFMIKFNMVSMFMLGVKELIDHVDIIDLEKQIKGLDPIDMIESSEVVLMSDKIDNLQLITEVAYTLDKDSDEDIECVSLISEELKPWFNRMVELKVGVHKYMKLVLYQHNKRIEDVYSVDYETLTIKCNSKLLKKHSYKIGLYVDLKEAQEYFKGVGYKLDRS